MGFNDFRFRTGIRIIFLGITLWLFTWLLHRPELLITAMLVGFVIILQMLELFNFVSQTNKKLTRFFESVKYGDFASGFTYDDKLGHSFRDLNTALSEVLEAFRRTRSEKEEHWLYLQTVVEHVNTGLISFNDEGKVGLINAAAKKLIETDQLRNVDQLLEIKPRLFKALFDLPSGKSALYKENNAKELAIHATTIRLQGKSYKLVAIQNIRSELQKKELDAWQNLTKVLRHEIMNSITPITSLTSTMKDIIKEDIVNNNGHFEIDEESLTDLQDGLDTIEGRSKGLAGFLDAYRDYTSIPLPDIKEFPVKQLIEKVAQLLRAEFKNAGAQISCSVHPASLTVKADEKLIEQVLINLVKNALEAMEKVKNPKVEVLSFLDVNQNVVISVKDNGEGIIREALEQIFIPFYTTKPRGSGIGLSLSSQIMRLHNGTLEVDSEPGVGTEFRLRF
ncbi:MAG: sensor histidine kinase [Candidatus Cyclobacteriaceae bacterium M2_1C_046]